MKQGEDEYTIFEKWFASGESKCFLPCGNNANLLIFTLSGREYSGSKKDF